MSEGAFNAEEIIVLVDAVPERVLFEVSGAAWRECQTEWAGLLFGRMYQHRGRLVVWVAAAVPGIGVLCRLMSSGL